MQVLDLVSTSRIHTLIVLDKTLTKQATEFFLTEFSSTNSNLLIIQRDPKEPIFDSQRILKIDLNMWIMQIHDDDDWKGSINIPNSAMGLELYETNFLVSSIEHGKDYGHTDSPPGRVFFSLLPSQIWNRFTDFIIAQGGHVAISMDFALSKISKAVCEKKSLDGFTYLWDDSNWRKRKFATRHLRLMAASDGWGNWGCVDLALLNRSLDLASAVSYFSDMIPVEKMGSLFLDILLEFSPSKRKMLFIKMRALVLPFVSLLLSTLFSHCSYPRLHAIQKRLVQRIKLDTILLEIWTNISLKSIILLVERIRNLDAFPLLQKRFDFWDFEIKKLLAVIT
jgi:hypothetical protein